MIVKGRRAAVTTMMILAVTPIAGCSTTNSTPTVTASAATGSNDTPAAPATSGAGEIVASGFGQQGEYAWVTSLVRNTSDHTGQTVIVSFNGYNAAGTLILTEAQTEAFSTPGQQLAVGTQVTVPSKQKLARVEATLDVKEDGIGPSDPQPSMPPVLAKIVKDYSSWKAVYDVVNPTATALKDVRIGVICRNAANAIIGGGSEFPTLLPPSGKVLASTGVITRGKPTTCTAYPSISGF